jgi:translation initiation factor 1 (eIF-1/SUI1)
MATGERAKEQQRDARRKRRHLSGKGADYNDVNGSELMGHLEKWCALGGAIRLGKTRDGGAFAVGVYGDGGDPYTEYLRPDESVTEFLIALVRSNTPE